ncbi:MAG: hypothetical protein IJ408_02635 [Clostridia bacterium]|nr:hypothetical protein [Clostridia bacterium]
MKKTISLLLITVLSLGILCGCDLITTDKNSIGKTANTAISTYAALEENFALRKLEGYVLYGAKLTVNSENVGRYTYIYTDKRPDNMNYSDILVVEVNTLNGKIEKCSAPDYATYSSEPYEMIKSGMPIEMTSFNIDSDAAIRTAANAHFGNNFVYNYIETTVVYENGAPVYKINHISLVNECVYNTVIDAMTGTVISKSVEDLY